MKDYRPGRWGVGFIFSCEGSVIPRAICCALPNALLAVAVWYFWRRVVDPNIFADAQEGTDTGQIWTGYNWVIGFTVAFRAQRAYARWWEGGTLLQQARGEWFNAYSSLIAFCSQLEGKRAEVSKFQQILARLMSMLYASALMSICTEPDLDFEIIDASGMNLDHLEYLRTQPDKCEIIMQWVQRLIVDNMGSGVLPIAPPVISRVFQELSRGIVNIHNVRKITEFQFPFPAAQMIVVMLIVQWILTPFVTGLLVGSPAWAFVLSFFPIFACWGINYLAGELEQPFGTDFNDMPLHFMQASMNSSILSLLDEESQLPPDFDMTKRINNHMVADPGKACACFQNLAPMRSVRWVTIADAAQLNRVKHRFTQGRDGLNARKMSRQNTMDFGRDRYSWTSNYEAEPSQATPLHGKPLSDSFKAPVSKEREVGRTHMSIIRRSSSRFSEMSEKPAAIDTRDSLHSSVTSAGDGAQLRVSGRSECNTNVQEIEDVEALPQTVTTACTGTTHPHTLPSADNPSETVQVMSGSEEFHMRGSRANDRAVESGPSPRQTERGADHSPKSQRDTHRGDDFLPHRIHSFSPPDMQQPDILR